MAIFEFSFLCCKELSFQALKKQREKVRKTEREKEKCRENESIDQSPNSSRVLHAWGDIFSHVTCPDFASDRKHGGSCGSQVWRCSECGAINAKERYQSVFSQQKPIHKGEAFRFSSGGFFLTCVFSVEILRCLPTFVRHDAKGKERREDLEVNLQG